MTTTYQIAEVADRSGFTPATLRYYEATGACNDTCGCISEPGGPPSSTVMAVPLLARPEGPGFPVADSCGDAGYGCAGDTPSEEPAIACTLDAAHMGTRMGDWADLLDAKGDLLAGVVARHAVDDGVRLDFGPKADVTEIARLAAAEQDCCRFFRFTISIDTSGVALEVRAPAEATEIVTALFGAAA